MYEEVIKTMNKAIEDLKELSKTNPELAKKKARENLHRAGILDKDGELAPPYNRQKVNEDDFTRGPREMRKIAMSDYLSEKTKNIEQKREKRVTWAEGIKVEGLPILTMEEVDKQLDPVIHKNADERDR